MNAATGLVEVRVPDMGNFKDVAIIDVLVKPGEKIEPEAPLVTLETEKATMDVPSTVGGVIEKIHIAKGGTVSPGDLIVTVRAEGAASKESVGTAEDKQASADASVTGEADSGMTGQADAAVSGQAAQAAATRADGSKQAAASRASAASPPQGTVASSPQGSPPPGPSGQPTSGQAASGSQNGVPVARVPAGRADLPPINEPGFSRAHAGPSVRRFARELGVDLTQVKGGGFKGRVTHDDVKAFVKKFLAGGVAATAAKVAPSSGGGGSLPAVPVVDFALFGPIETRPLTRIQKISGPRLHASWVNIPHVTQFDEADITELEDARGKLKEKAQQANIKLTPLAFILRACVKALQDFPLFNSSLDATGANLVLKKYVHLGFAADTPNGLVVPVVRDANRKDVYEIARQLGELSEKARAGKLSVADMQGGSFTISSLGGIGGTAFTPIINAPEVAILGVSRSAIRPVFRDGTFVPRLILPLSLSYDHRVIDGASAARFTTYLAQALADPRGLMEAVP
jgi:pyruvate dehydrogenase E2 component (dihydrolipoamide acetyltransferase)